MPQTLAKTELFGQWLGGNLVVADQGLSTGRRVWVHSGTGLDAGGHGANPDAPVATLEYAVGLCTANKGDIIYLMPGHSEVLAAAGELADLDKAGIIIQGLGVGALRPTFTLTHADAQITVDGASMTIRNIRVAANIANVAQAFDVGAAAHGLTVEDCEFEDGADAAKELTEAIKIAAGCDDVTIRNCRFLTTTGGTIVSAITFEGASDNSRIEGCYFNGDYGTAAILGSVAAQTRLVILNNFMKVLDGEPGIELHANSLGLIIGNRIESTGATADTAIVADDCSWFDNWCVIGDGLTAELIGTRIEVLGADAIAASSIADNALSEEHIDADAAQRMRMGLKVTRAAADVLDGTTTPLFTVAGGMVAIHGIVGIVSVAAADTGASDTQYSANPTTGTANALCAVLDLTDAEVGAMLSMTGEAATALLKGSGGVVMCVAPVCVNIGTIDLISGLDIGTGGALVAFTLYYTPIDTGASVVAA